MARAGYRERRDLSTSAARVSARLKHSEWIRLAMTRITLEHIVVSNRPQMYHNIAIAVCRRFCECMETPAIWAQKRGANRTTRTGPASRT